MILGFFKNILLGGAITGLLKIFEDPAKFLTDLEDAYNGFADFANGIIQSVSNFIFAPYNAIITSINDAINELEFALKKSVRLFLAYRQSSSLIFPCLDFLNFLR